MNGPQSIRRWPKTLTVMGLALLSACPRFEGRSSPDPKPGTSTQPSEDRETRENSQILAEMYRVIFLRPATNPQEFGAYVGSLNAGASLDAIHNGFTHSVAYQVLEQTSDRPSEAAFSYFVDEFVQASRDLKRTVGLTGVEAKPLLLTAESARREVSQPHTISFPKASPQKGLKALSVEEARTRVRKNFGRASRFTLKRVLSTLLMEALDEKWAGGPEGVADWYADFVVRAASLKVDFGLPERNLADRTFHREWAMKAKPQRLRWEVLNRVHRVLNSSKALES